MRLFYKKSEEISAASVRLGTPTSPQSNLPQGENRVESQRATPSVSYYPTTAPRGATHDDAPPPQCTLPLPIDRSNENAGKTKEKKPVTKEVEPVPSDGYGKNYK